jgi:uncharacterized alkaline shock family protein YloU
MSEQADRPEPEPTGESPTAAAAPAVLERAGDAVRERAEEVRERAGDAVERAGDAVERAAAASGRVASTVVGRLRNDAELAAERGTTRIEDEVVEKIAGIAARAVPGVHDLGGDTARFFASVRDRVGLGEAGKANQGVSARLAGRTAKIGVTLMVEYGVRVHPVTEQVRAAVIEAVERMLDLQVTEVNIVVDDVQVPDPPAADRPAG